MSKYNNKMACKKASHQINKEERHTQFIYLSPSLQMLFFNVKTECH